MFIAKRHQRAQQEPHRSDMVYLLQLQYAASMMLKNVNINNFYLLTLRSSQSHNNGRAVALANKNSRTMIMELR